MEEIVELQLLRRGGSRWRCQTCGHTRWLIRRESLTVTWFLAVTFGVFGALGVVLPRPAHVQAVDANLEALGLLTGALVAAFIGWGEGRRLRLYPPAESCLRADP